MSDATVPPINQLVAQFMAWEQASRDTIDFKKSYVDMAGDLVAGLTLSQIVYWHLPGRNGVTKLSVSHDGEFWIAKRREDWWDEIRITPKQLDRALKILESKGLIVTALYHFNAKPMKHIRLNWAGFIVKFQQSILPKGENRTAPILTKGENAISPKVKILNREYTQRIPEDKDSLPNPPSGASAGASIAGSQSEDHAANTADSSPSKESDAAQPASAGAQSPSKVPQKVSPPDGFKTFYRSAQGCRTLHLARDGANATLCNLFCRTLNELQHADDGLEYTNYQSVTCPACLERFEALKKVVSPAQPVTPGGVLPVPPRGYSWAVSSAVGTLAHLARSENGRPLCGTALPHRSSAYLPIGPREACAECVRIAETPKGSPAKADKPARPRNPVFDAIALGSFNIAAVTGKVGGRIGALVKEVTECTPEQHRATLADDLTAMYAWYKRVHADISAPAKAETICKYLAEWREAAKPNAAQVAKPDPNCKHCGGIGMIDYVQIGNERHVMHPGEDLPPNAITYADTCECMKVRTV